MKKWIAAFLFLVMLTQALPFTAFADAVAAGKMITDSELQRALQIAGMKVVAETPGAEKSVAANGVLKAANDGNASLRVRANESGYHSGMTPDETWDAQMLMDWLDDKLTREIYNVINVYTRAETILELLKDTNSEAYAQYTQNAYYLDICHKWAMDAEVVEEKGRLLRKRVGEYTVVIESNTEMLANASDSLFEHEKARLSEQIREATAALEELRDEIVDFSVGQIFMIITGQLMIDGTIEPEFSAWLKDVLSTEDGPEEVTVPSNAIVSAAYNTRTSRMAVSERVLSNPGSQDVSVHVVTENEFAIVPKGVDNKLLSGVTVTVRDLNGSAVRTLTTDSKYGSAIFNANDFVCDYDKEMELSLEVRADSLGYRNFYIPWMIIKRGGKRTETLTLLTGPETKANAAAREAEQATSAVSNAGMKPYIYSCTFNGYDILHNEKITTISTANDAQVSFEVKVAHPAGMTPKAPELYCYVNDTSGIVTKTVKKKFSPTSSILEGSTITKFVFRSTWKRDLAPEITVDKDNPNKDQRPYFVLPDTNETYRTKLVPERSKVDKPTINAQDHKNPFNTVFGKGFNMDMNVPYIGGRLSLALPFDQYLPKIAFDPTGWVSVTFGSSLVKDPKDATIWKSQEQEQYSKAMKKFQHDTSLAGKKQSLGTAKDFYKPITEGGSHMATVKFDFGYFVMLSGYGELDDNDGSLWSLRGAVGGEFVLSVDYTVAMTVVFVPVYMNVNFSLAIGMAIDTLYFSFGFDRDFKLTSFDWNALRGVTFNFRLALSVSLGIGVKGICSVWISATGCLNFIISLIRKQPTQVYVYLELFVSVGFEIFWIKYSKDIWQSPRFKIYSSTNNNAKASLGLFTAYAEEGNSEDMPLNPLAPERYPSLAPMATKVLDGVENARAKLKTVECNGQQFVFYLAPSTTKDTSGNTHRRISWLNLNTRQRGDIQQVLNGIVYTVGTNEARTRNDYDFDVRSNGKVIAIVACCANQFTEDGHPVENSSGRGFNTYMYMLALEANAQGGLQRANDVYTSYSEAELWTNEAYYPIVSEPRIENMNVVARGNSNFVVLHGGFKGYSTSNPQRSGFVSFCMLAEPGSWLATAGDGCVKSGMGDKYMRTDLHSGYFAKGDNWDSFPYYSDKSFSWVGLSRLKDGSEGDSGIELFDWDMNVAGRGKVQSVVLARGDIGGFAVLQFPDNDGKRYSQNIFYTETETVGERKQTRLKGIYISPKSGMSTRNISFNLTYNDYDLSLPTRNLNVVTIGASQYLYWLSTVSKEKETDPDVWRISGVYYDAVNNSMSDELVIAEFSLPNARWKGKNWKSVPYEITLTENGTGYITAKPNTNDEKDRDIAPLTLYSFPMTLKPVANLKGASLMETTVCSGEFVATDVTVMNEGNMGIGSFDVELWLMENGREKQKIETLHADCLVPANSKLVMHNGGRDETVMTGEAAFYRLKDFIYSPKQKEWIVKSEGKTIAIKNGTEVSTSAGSSNSNRLVTNVLVPGSLGGYTGHIKIPTYWSGDKQLRLKLTRESTYSNWLAASALAKSNPELFAEGPVGNAGSAASNARKLAELGIVKLDYALDEKGEKMLLQAPEGYAIANDSSGTARLFANGNDDGSIRLYATEIEAPRSVDIDCSVHDIDVSHRVFDDYYGEEMLEITLNNYNTSKDSISLTCAVYLNDAKDPVYVNLPYDPNSISSGKTQTITVPVSAILDPETTEKARFVFTPRGVKETATVNNEFTIYPGGSAVKTPLSVTGAGTLTPIKDVDGGTLYVDVPLGVKTGGTAVFHVDVTGGTPPYNYQWQVYDTKKGKWVDLVDSDGISGATTDTLTLEKVKPEWDGRRARSIITDADGVEIRYGRELDVRDSEMPDTGDPTNLPLYLVVAAIAIALLALIRRRRAE